jgi:hypothetical protein
MRKDVPLQARELRNIGARGPPDRRRLKLDNCDIPNCIRPLRVLRRSLAIFAVDVCPHGRKAHRSIANMGLSRRDRDLLMFAALMIGVHRAMSLLTNVASAR